MRPILFDANETSFETLGLGILTDATSCTVTEERNGVYELEMQYPITGQHYAKIKNRCLICAEVNQDKDRQPFRIYKITRPLKGIVKIYAQHLSYDLSGIVLTPFSANSITQALALIKTKSSTTNPFTFETDKTTTAAFSVDVPSTIRSIMGGQEGSLLDAYGGEYAYDKYTVKLLTARGTNRGVSIRYGKNLTDLTQEENIQNVVTGVYPYWSSDDDYVELPEKIVQAPGTYDFVKIKPLDASSEFDEAPTVDKLRSYATNYVNNNDVGVPKISISVKFQPLEQTEEYKTLAPLQQVHLCDTVTVIFERLGVNATAECIKTVYDVLKGRYKEISLGDAKTNITDTILSQGQEIERVSSPEFIQPYVASATKLITGNKGGYVVLHSSTGAETPDEILVMDTPSVNTASQVWRWNKSGLGYSAAGYAGPYSLAMTMDGKIVADFIATGTLDAAEINVINLIAESVKSTAKVGAALESVASIEISAAELKAERDGKRYIWITLGNDGETPQIMLLDGNGAETTALSAIGVTTPRIVPSPSADFKWKYISSIGETVLVKQ